MKQIALVSLATIFLASAAMRASEPARAAGPTTGGPNVIHTNSPAAPAPNIITALTPSDSPTTLPDLSAPFLQQDNSIHLPTAEATPARRVPRDVTVQGPASDSSYSSFSDAWTATGPVNVSAWLDSSICRGGPLHVSAVVSDVNGNAISGANVSGYVQYDDNGHSIDFPASGSDGFTDMSFNSGNPHGGYRVVISIHADNGSDHADTMVSCYAR